MEERAQGEIVKWGFISLIVLMVVIMVNDVSALMTGKLSFKAMKDKAKEVRQQKKDAEAQSQAGSDESTPKGEVPAHLHQPPMLQELQPRMLRQPALRQQILQPKDTPAADSAASGKSETSTPKTDARRPEKQPQPAPIH